jgi:hypothetical protein
MSDHDEIRAFITDPALQQRLAKYMVPSGVTSKAANGGHFKTGQRKWPGTRLFYSVAS